VIAFWLFLANAAPSQGQAGTNFNDVFVNFETAPVHPIALSPNGQRLAVCNLADGKLELFDVTSGNLGAIAAVPVGTDPVSVRFRNDNEAWVVNQISRSISVVDINSPRVKSTIETLETPADVVFAGSPTRAFVSCAQPNILEVFEPETRLWITNVLIDAERPKALAVSPDGRKVYAAIFESGNATTVIGGTFRNLLFFDNAVSRTNGPYNGQNPPPNQAENFSPPLNPTLPTNVLVPPTGLIVRKNDAGRWMDDNLHDWTEFVSGTNAALTQRVFGWDLPDRDLAIVDATDLSVNYASGLMNQCMALDVNPASGRIAVIGTDAINEVRFEPNLNGVFVRVKIATVNPLDHAKALKDLNPHLDYSVRMLPQQERDKSIGDPRAIAWTADGTRAYIAGMGSRNIALIDTEGNRLDAHPIEVGEGPCGLALDESRARLYVFNRFSCSLSVVDTTSNTVINAVPLFDPTPLSTAAGRRHLYDTRRTSGLGQAACASCHTDARMDRLGWDLGNPAGSLNSPVVNHQGTLVTNNYHPMKGVMVTQTLQDIIGHEPFHWRGDRPDIESFNATFTNLQASASGLTKTEMRELRDFLGSIRFPPNAYRQFDNSLSTNIPLPGHTALGENVLPAGAQLPNGNALSGLALFSQPVNFCATCHTLPTGLGIDSAVQQGVFKPIALGPNGEHHLPLAFRLEGPLRSKIAQFRNMHDKIGMDSTRAESRAGFGFGHDGSIDSLTRFLNGVRIVEDQETADLIAFLISVSGSDTAGPASPADLSVPAAVGRQLTLASAARPPLFDAMLALARSSTSRVDLIAKGLRDGLARGWFYNRSLDLFQSDRQEERLPADQLLALAAPGSELTFTVVSRGTGLRLGIDRDLDGIFDRDELDAGSNVADPQLAPRIIAPGSQVPTGVDLVLEVQVPPLPAAGVISWLKNGQPIADATNSVLTVVGTAFSAAGSYTAIVSTPFQTLSATSVQIAVVPLLVNVSPLSQSVRRGSNALLTASTDGIGPFHYQWQFNGQEMLNATNALLSVANVQLADEGAYQITVANSFGAVTSAPANLGVLIAPSVIIPPLSQTVVEGGNATFGFMISGHPGPFGYQLRKSSVILTNYTSDELSGFLTLFNVQSSNAGTYRIVVTNAANVTPGLVLDPVTLTILKDSDHDGLPDEWEAAHGLATNNAADAQLDFDLDGQANWQEYIAGTDPQNIESYLKVDRLVLATNGGSAVIQFNALSNRTYTVQYRDSLLEGSWTKVADVLAFPTNRIAAVTNEVLGTGTRYYRLVTPRIP